MTLPTAVFFAGIGMPPVKSLNAVTTTGAGQAYALSGTVNNFTVQITTTGSPSISVTLQGSLDGTNWFNIGSAITSTGLTTFTNAIVPYVRLNLGTLSGGTCTGWICGV